MVRGMIGGFVFKLFDYFRRFSLALKSKKYYKAQLVCGGPTLETGARLSKYIRKEMFPLVGLPRGLDDGLERVTECSRLKKRNSPVKITFEQGTAVTRTAGFILEMRH